MSALDVLSQILWFLAGFLVFAVTGASIVATHQESKIWAVPKIPSLSAVGFVKVFFMNQLYMYGSMVGTVLSLLSYFVNGDTRTFAHGVWERYQARIMCQLFLGPVEVRGAENLPKPTDKGPAPVLIANHVSEIDAAAVYTLDAQWKFVGKSSVMFVPGMGSLMYLSKHVMINRGAKKGDKSSTGTQNLYIQSNEAIQSGVPMFLFPQGTRRMAERLPFKNGAFKIAMENKTNVVPISLEIPLTAWNNFYPLTKTSPVVITVHPPITSVGKDMDTLNKECFDKVYSVLPDYSKLS